MENVVTATIPMIDYQGRTYYYVKDHLGSTRVLVRDNGVTSAKYYRYAANGECKKEKLSISQPNKTEDVKTVRLAGIWTGRSEVLT
jgi:hypothetical protein